MARIRQTETSAVATVVEPRKKAQGLVSFWRIPEELDVRLCAVARSERMPKRSFLAKIVDAGLRRYALDQALRNALAPAQSEDVAES